MPPVAVDFAKVWETKASSDVTLLVYPYHETGQGRGKPEPVAKLQLHGVILASAVPHFEAQLHGAWQAAMGPQTEEEPGPDAGGSRKRSGAKQKPAAAKRPSTGAPSAAAGKVLELMCFPGEPHTVPEAVMCHVYTGRLPDEPVMLAWIIKRADYLVMHGTVEACLAKMKELSDADTLTLQGVISIVDTLDLSALDEKYRAAVEQTVASMAGKLLSSQLGSTRQVFLDKQLLDQFVQLPFQLLKQWAMMESLVVDSENTIALLITCWCDHQQSSAARRSPHQWVTTRSSATGVPLVPKSLGAVQREELSALLCPSKLTPSFHLTVVPHLCWYRALAGLPQQHAAVRCLASLYPIGTVGPVKSALGSGGVAGRAQGPATAERQWFVSRQQLATLLQEQVLVLDDSIYLAGCTFTAKLTVHKASAPDPLGQVGQPAEHHTLGFYLKPVWPEVLIDHGVAAQVGLPVTVVQLSFSVGSEPAMGGSIILCDKVTCTGWPDVVHRTFIGLEDLVAFMATRECKLVLSEPC